jgi:hypothetical protein
MKKISAQIILGLAFIAGLSTHSAFSQTTSFDIETSADDITIIKSIVLPGNSIAILSWDPTHTNIILKVHNADGTERSNTDISGLFNWPHTTHGAVEINAVATNDGHIFITYAANSNSTGIQTYNGRYILIDENGAALASGQLNDVDAGSSYTWHVILEKLSDGKIVAIWRRSQNENMVFRIFNSNGTAFNNDVAFAGTGTGEAQNVLYTVQAAAGKNGNFMISLYYWTGNLRGYLFDNNGYPAFGGGGYAFDIDPTITSNYGNYGLVALTNGNFAACWAVMGQNYLKIIDRDGSDVVGQKSIGTSYISSLFAVHTAGEEGFYSSETVKLIPGPSDPHATASLTKYNQLGDVLSTTDYGGGFLIQPSFNFMSGIGGGFMCVYTYYKTFMTMPFPMNMSFPTGDRDARAMTFDLSLSTLPVQLISFEARRITDTKVILSWKTASEVNNHHFEVEKSIDGRNFSNISRVMATGNGSTVTDYSYTDIDNSSTHLFYRLKQYDQDGKCKDLGTRLVRNGKAGKLAMVYPNPVTGNTLTVLTGDQPLPQPYRLTDAQGKTLQRGNLSQSQQELRIDDLNEGIYFLQVGQQIIKIKK